MRTLRLFIEGEEIELNEKVNFSINKAFEDLTNPTVIINDWSKTINIPFSEKNNKIFGHIYSPDRVILGGVDAPYIGVNFDPTKKLDFRLENGSDVIMTGYAKMNSITKKKGFGTYNITLNGVLGKVFQELSKITFNLNEDIDEKYKINGAQYVSTQIDRNLVKSSWQSSGQTTMNLKDSSVLDIIGFAPNNSFSEEFDYNTYQNGANSCKKFTDVLNEKTEWQELGINADSVIPDGMTPRGIGEFRSYQQIPFIYFNKLFQIFKEKGEEVTGYKFILDQSWFGADNPRWSKLVYTLKQFDIKNGDLKTNTYGRDRFIYGTPVWTTGNYTEHKDVRLILNSTSGMSEEVPMYRQYPSYWTFYDVPTNADNIAIKKDIDFTVGWVTNGKLQNNNALVMNITMNAGNDPDSAVPVSTCKFLIKTESCTLTEPNAIEVIVPEDTENYVIPFTCNCVFRINRDMGTMFSFDTHSYWLNNNQPFKRSGSSVSGGTDVAITGGSMTYSIYNGFFRSGADFILNDLWNNEYNVFEEILNYCKMHRILIIADDVNKELKFIPSTTYFNSYQILDWDDKVDYSKDFIVKPITFENKYVLFNYRDSDTKLGKNYKEKFKFNYGEKNLVTDYNFNTETEKLFEDKISQSLTNTDSTLSWTNLMDYCTISYSFPNEIFVYSKDDDGNYVPTFGAYYFHRGLANFNNESELRMRPVKISDDTDYQMAVSTYFYSQAYESTSCMTYPKLDVVYNTNELCIFNKPNECYTYDKNKFDSDLGDDIAVRKSQVLRNSVVRPPMLLNEDNSLIGISFDPAKKRDNAFVLVGKFIHDDKRGWLLEIVNGINLIDKETQKPLTTPEMITELQDIIVRYNGYGNPDYVNIHGVFIDAGSGGGATQICDFLFDSFYEKNHKNDDDYKHKGLIDKEYEYAIPYIKRYPEAIDKIRLREPSKYKAIMYTQMCEMIDQDLISFTADYDYHGNLTILSEEKGQVVETNYKLTLEEEIALKQLDAMKEEVTHMYKYRASNGNIRYDLAPGFENILHDDRSYCLALLGHALYELRSQDMVRQRKKKSDTDDLLSQLTIRPARRVGSF